MIGILLPCNLSHGLFRGVRGLVPMKNNMFFRSIKDGFASASRRSSNFSVLQLKLLVRMTLVIVLVGVCLAAAIYHHGWLWMLGHSRPAINGASGISAQPLTSGGSVGTFTTLDVSGAGTSADQGTLAICINAAGASAGIYSNETGLLHGFVRAADGTVATFDAPDAGTSSNGNYVRGTFPMSINTAGDVVGVYFDANNGYHGFLRLADGAITEFDAPGAGAASSRGTAAMSINDTDEIAGFYTTGNYQTNSVYHGFLRTANGTYTTIDAPNAGTVGGGSSKPGTQVIAINAAGEIAGSYLDSNMNRHGFMRSASGTFTEFDPPGTDTAGIQHEPLSGTSPMSIDAAGDIAGMYTDASAVEHGFVRSAADGTFTEFNPQDMSTSSGGVMQGTLALGMDPGGNYVTGSYSDASGMMHGFVRVASGAITEFSAPGAAAAMPYLPGTGAVGVNASGEITGGYGDANEVVHGYLFIPTVALAATPTFLPGAGTYSSPQPVTISDTTPNATIYYAINKVPTTGSTEYGGEITISSSETLEAIAIAPGYSASAVGSAAYIINTATNPAPVIGSLSPAFIDAGGATFPLTVNGSGFTANSTVYWGTSALSTTYGSASLLTAQVSAADIATGGISVAITVETPTPGGGTSNSYGFEVDTSSGTTSGPIFTSTTATVTAGSTASYPVTLPSTVTSVSVTCLNLPTGATCSYSSTTGTVTIATSSTTPAGTYQITVVFAETVSGAATSWILLPILLLPLVFFRRKKMAARRIWVTACLGLALIASTAIGIGCSGGGSSSPTTPATHQVTSSGAVSLTIH